jgi:cell division transport system ATP-binding protein
MRLLIRDVVATQGQVILDGEDLARLPRRKIPRVRRKIGTVFQDFKLLPNKTARENVAFALEVTGTPRGRIRPSVDRVLRLVGLTAQADQYPRQLSGGEQQRTAIASSTNRGSSSPTSRPATSIRSSAGRSSSSSCGSTSSA